MTLRPETNLRTADIISDNALPRIGNTGSDLLADTLTKISQALGTPFEVVADDPISLIIKVSASIYSLPDGRRLSAMRSGNIPIVSSANINFSNGTISSGSSSSFNLPNMSVGNYIKALVQYSFGKNAFGVIFGSQNSLLSLATIPSVSIDFEPLAVLELHSIAGGIGVFENISNNEIILIKDSLDFEDLPKEERIVVVAPQTVFNLATIQIPSVRKRLSVYRNGVYQIQDIDYSVTDDTTVTFPSPVTVNAEMLFKVI